MADPLMPPLDPPVPSMVDTTGRAPKPTPIGEIMQQEFLQQQQLTAVNLLRAVRKSPDDTARDLVVARDLGMPPSLVAGSPDLRARAKAERIKGDIAGSPVLQRKYSDEDFAAIAQDDSSALSKIQSLVGSTVAYVMGATPSGGAPGALYGGLYPRSLRASAGAGRLATEVAAAGLAYLGADKAAETLNQGAKSFAETAAWAENKLAAHSAKNPGFFQAAVDSGMQSAGQFSKYAPLMFAGPTGVLAAIGLMATETAGTTYATDREKKLSITRSAAHAAADATWEAAGEMLLGLKGFAALVTSGASVARLLRYELTREVAGEVPVTLGQNFNEWLLVNPEKSAADWAREQPEAALSTVISTVVAGGVQAGASRGAVRFIQDVMSREILSSESAKQANALEEMMKTALDAQLRTRSPESFRAAVQEMVEDTGGAATSVYVESANFEQLSPEDIALLPENIQRQISASTDSTLIEVPMGDVLTVAPGTELEKFFVEHGKIGSPEALSRAEAKQASATAAEWLQSRADAIIRSAVDQEAAIAAHEKMVGNLATQIESAGAFDPETSRSLARVAGAFYTAMGNHFGASALTLAQEFPITVRTAARTLALTGVSQTAVPAATPETFTAEGVGDLLRTGAWSVMTAENPGGQDTDAAVNAAANANLRKELVDAGYTVIDVKGRYGRDEDSFVVLGITPRQALYYGQKYGQESVLAPQGLIYQDGGVTPATGVTVHPAAPADFYTTLPDGTTFTVDLNFDAERSQTLEQTTSVREGRESLRKYGLKPGQRYTTRQVAAALEARQRAKWGSIDPKDRSPEAAAKIAKWMVAEVQFELENPEESGLGWYREKFQRGLDVLSEMFPELKEDKQARDTMTAIIAITSDGKEMHDNLRMAIDIYRNFREGGAREGEFTTTRGSLHQPGIDAVLARFQDTYDRLGPERIHEYLMHEETIRELNKIAKENGASVNTSYQTHLTMPMSTVVMGPKLGAFYANLMGSDKYLTMDRWWSRTFNRYRGTLVTAPTKAGLDRFRELLGQPELSDDETIAATVPYEASYREKGFKNGTEIETAANTIYKAAFVALQDVPFGAKDRTFMLEAVAKAQQLLKRRGVSLPASEIQAILWYYEKRLYGEIGTRQTPYVDYGIAARRVVDELATAVRGDARGAPQDRADTGGEVPVGQESYGLEQPGPVTAAPAASYGEPRRNSVSVIGVHFGKSESTTLHASRYGTGLKGAERARLAGQPDLQNRIYFYVNEGSGVSPEAGVGPHARAVVLHNVYDSAADPLKIYTTDTNAFERAVMAAGFDGYYARGAFGKQGVAVLLGQHTVQTEVLADPTDAAGYELPPAIELSPIRQFRKGILEDSRLLFGLMKEADVKRLAPDLHQKMLDLGAKFDPKETYYRSDLAKLVPESDGALEQAGVAQTDTPEFKAWFGDSKVVDAEGKPLVVMHASTYGDITSFTKEKQRFGKAGYGFYFSNAAGSNIFAEYGDRFQSDRSARGEEKAVKTYPVYLSLKNPLIVEHVDDLKPYLDVGQKFGVARGVFGNLAPDAILKLQKQGYDGIITRETTAPKVHKTQGLKILDRNDQKATSFPVYVAFEPTQIKSAIGNRGTFDPNAPSILEQAPSYARAQFSPRDLSITLTPDADFNTFNHEMSHFFLTVMSRLAQRSDAPEALKNDMKLLGDWFSSKGGDFLMSEIARYRQNYEKRALALEKSEPGSENAKAARRRADRTAAAYDYVVMNGGGLVMTKACYDLGASVPEEFRLDITRPMQEAFAEAGERYFLEGKAPTKELRSVFRRFVKMATDAMRRLRQTIELSDEVRGVFDRVLGAEVAVQAAEDRAGMTADEAASDSATEKLRTRSLRDLKWGVKARSEAIKALQKTAEAERATVEAEVRQEVEQRPLYRAIRWLRKGETIDPVTGEEVKAGRGFRLDARAVVGMYPESGLNRPDLEKLKGMTQREGLSPEIVAEMFGYSNGDALIRALAAAEPIETVIEGETNQRMLEEHGDLVDQKAIEEAANEAVHNELRRRQIANELKSQMEVLATRRDTGRVTKAGARVTVSVLQEAASRFASSIVANVPLARLRDAAREHMAAEKAAAKRWQEAYTKTRGEKDPGVEPFVDAVRAKQDQLLHNSAAKAALEAASETNKALKFFKYVLRDSNEKLVKNGRDPDIVNAARMLLSAYGLGGRREAASVKYMELVKINDPTLYETLQAAADTTEARPAGELTFPELQELRDNVEALWTLAKRSREVEIGGKKIALAEAVAPLAERLDEIGVPERIPGEKWAVTEGEKRRSTLKFARALHARMEQWVEGIDGRYGGPFRRFVYQPIKTAADNFRTEKNQRLKELKALGEELAPHIRRGRIAAPELDYVFGSGKGEMGITELLHAILHTGNESNKRKLLLGREWGELREDGSLDTSKWDGFIDRLIKDGTLTKAHFDYAQGVWDLLESLKPRAQQAHREVFGRYFDEVTAQPFDTPWGTYRGGYVPAKADPRIVRDADLRALAEREKDNMRFVLPTTQKGFTKARVEYNVPLLLDLTSLSQHIHQVLLFSHMESVGRDVNKILRDKEVGGRLGRINEKAISELITPWLNGSVKQLVSTPTIGDQSMAQLANVVRMRTAMSFMFANVSNTLQQPSGFLTAWAKLRSDNLRSDMLRATAKYLTDPRGMSAAVTNQSQFMASRMANEVHAMNDAVDQILLNPSLYERAADWTKQHAYFLQHALETVTGPIIWTAGYNGHYAKHGSETEAVQYADSLIRQTLGSSLPEDLSRLERGNAYVKPFVMFFGYFSMLANTNIAMVQKTISDLGVRRGAGKSIGLVTVGGLAALWFAEAVTVMMRGEPEDEDLDGYLDDWIIDVMGLGTIKGLTAMVPFVGQAGMAAVNAWNSKPYDDRMSVSPVVAAGEAMARTPVSVYKAISGEGSVKKAVNDLSATLSVLTGLPVTGATRGVGYVVGMAAGEVEPTSTADLVRGLIQGSVSPESRVR